MKAKKWYESKTLWVNVIVVALAALTALTNQGDLPAEWEAIVAAVIAVLNIGLRFVTNRPIEF